MMKPKGDVSYELSKVEFTLFLQHGCKKKVNSILDDRK